MTTLPNIPPLLHLQRLPSLSRIETLQLRVSHLEKNFPQKLPRELSEQLSELQNQLITHLFLPEDRPQQKSLLKRVILLTNTPVQDIDPVAQAELRERIISRQQPSLQQTFRSLFSRQTREDSSSVRFRTREQGNDRWATYLVPVNFDLLQRQFCQLGQGLSRLTISAIQTKLNHLRAALLTADHLEASPAQAGELFDKINLVAMTTLGHLPYLRRERAHLFQPPTHEERTTSCAIM